jgi:hypothetical protein
VTGGPRKLGPPKGGGDERLQMLAGRFGAPQEDQPPVAEPDPGPPPVVPDPVPLPEPEVEPVQPVDEPVAGRRRSNDTPGMVRQTYYVATSTVEALDTAVDAVRKQLGRLGPRVATHEILAAIVAAGIADTAGVAANLRKSLLED